eukprot:4880494-Pleurochrysis_carterae.AAC.1
MNSRDRCSSGFVAWPGSKLRRPRIMSYSRACERPPSTRRIQFLRPLRLFTNCAPHHSLSPSPALIERRASVRTIILSAS